jgi:integrase
VVLSVEEVSDILMAAPGPGLKYQAALSISYGAGLRAAEVCNLKIGDIDSDRMLIHVELGKGQKDRKVILSPGLLELLRAWWREARPEGWLFPSKPKINPISPRQLNRAFTSAKHMAGVKKPATLHTLRHSFAYRSKACAVSQIYHLHLVPGVIGSHWPIPGCRGGRRARYCTVLHRTYDTSGLNMR